MTKAEEEGIARLNIEASDESRLWCQKGKMNLASQALRSVQPLNLLFSYLVLTPCNLPSKDCFFLSYLTLGEVPRKQSWGLSLSGFSFHSTNAAKPLTATFSSNWYLLPLPLSSSRLTLPNVEEDTFSNSGSRNSRSSPRRSIDSHCDYWQYRFLLVGLDWLIS